MIMNVNFGQGSITRRDMSGHADYPHQAGTLYDCTACESNCFCAELREGQILDAEQAEEELCVHCAIGAEQFQAQADHRFGRRS